MGVRLKAFKGIFWVCFCSVALTAIAYAGNKQIMTIKAAKVLAERVLVESIYGLKIRAEEEVVNMIAASFVGKTESKTSALIKGVNFEDIVYDADKDLARVTASVSLPSITNIDGKVIDLKNKVFRRVAFATSTPSTASAIQALRAAEIDAYKELAKRLLGFTLESKTTVDNYLLTSDVVKTKLLATVYLAELTDYGWNDNGNAYVKLRLNIKEVSDILGEAIVDNREVLEVEGQGSQVNDFKTANEK